MDRQKVSHVANSVVRIVSELNFDPNECVALLKCLEHVFQTRCIEKDLVVASLRTITEICAGREPLETILPKNGK